jgi:hypothetical protein
MKRIYTLALWLALGAAGLFWWASSVAAQGGYDLSWWTVEGGGASSGGSYQLVGVAGQMDAGVMSDGTFTLTGGFMAATEASGSHLFMPMIEGEE